MKKGLFGTLALARMLPCLFSRAVRRAKPSVPADGLVRAARGYRDGHHNGGWDHQHLVDGSNHFLDSGATYQSMIHHTTDKTPSKGTVKRLCMRTAHKCRRRDRSPVALPPPVTASEPPQRNPDKIVVTAQGDSGTAAGVQKEFGRNDYGDQRGWRLPSRLCAKGRGGDAADDLRAVVSADTVISSESEPGRRFAAAPRNGTKGHCYYGRTHDLLYSAAGKCTGHCAA